MSVDVRDLGERARRAVFHLRTAFQPAIARHPLPESGLGVVTQLMANSAFNHILEQIFLQLDGNSLAAAAAVCVGKVTKV